MANTTEKPKTAKVAAACETHWATHEDDCSGFVKAVAKEVGVTLTGQANDIVNQMKTLPWKSLGSGAEAKKQADLGYLVLGGLKATKNGHVVVVVAGPLGQGKYPTAYWGQLGGVGRKATTVNWSWNKTDRDKVEYAYYKES
jgi:hypothetical protein